MISWYFCALIWFKNIEKMLLQMTSGFLQLESTIHVINQNFYNHQNFKEQIEDEFNRTLNEFEHTEPFNRPLLPK
jgi:hypothetical protein